jgi:hypothetical protein
MDILPFLIIFLLIFVMMLLSLRIGIFGVINIPIILFLIVLASDGITMKFVIDNNIVESVLIDFQQLVFIISILILIQFLIIIYKLKS